MNIDCVLDKCRELDFNTVLEIGAGDVVHSAPFFNMGKELEFFDCGKESYTLKARSKKFDLAWCTVLSMQPNIKTFISKMRYEVNGDGWIVITVPSYTHNITSKELSAWNAGRIILALINAGLDCSKAKVKTHLDGVSVMVRNAQSKSNSIEDNFPIPFKEGMDGRIEELNWHG